MKALKIFAMIMVFGIAVGAAADNLEKYMPADANTAARLKPRKLFDLPLFKDQDKNSDVSRARAIIEKLNLTGSGLPTTALLVHSPKYKNPTIISPVTYTPVQLGGNLAKLNQEFPNITYSELNNANNTGYKVVFSLENERLTIYINYLENEVISLGTDGSIPPVELKAGELPNPLLPLLKNIADKEVVRIVSLSPKVPQQMGGLDLQNLTLSVFETSNQETAFEAKGELEFDKPESALRTATMLQMFLGLGLMQLAGDGQLIEQTSQDIKFRAAGNKTVMDAKISVKLINTLKDTLGQSIYFNSKPRAAVQQP